MHAPHATGLTYSDKSGYLWGPAEWSGRPDPGVTHRGPQMRQPKIVVVGAGLVGGSAALFLSYTIPGVEIVVIDLERIKAEGQVLDLIHAAALWRSARFRAGTYEEARDADIVV